MKLLVHIFNQRAGTLERLPRITSTGKQIFRFCYLQEYLEKGQQPALGFCFPLLDISFDSEGCLHPFFQNLLAEGWMLKQQSRMGKIDERDYFELLAEFGENLVGAVSVTKQNGGL